MVVSAILLATMAPITGALFGASYGTAIRIGYEIIFPALFGDMINAKKNVGQEEGAKRTIKALHTMFTATGGASALEFGIEQGIEMAKKKTESPDVQDMIDLNLGLTNRQLKLRGKAAVIGTGGNLLDEIQAEKDLISNVQAFSEPNLGDFQMMSTIQILNFFKKFKTRFEFDPPFSLLAKERGLQNTLVQRVLKLRPPAKSVQEVINKVVPKGSVVNQIASQFNQIKSLFDIIRKGFKNIKSLQGRGIRKKQVQKALLKQMKTYNRFVQLNRKPHLTIDTAKSLNANRIIPKS